MTGLGLPPGGSGDRRVSAMAADPCWAASIDADGNLKAKVATVADGNGPARPTLSSQPAVSGWSEVRRAGLASAPPRRGPAMPQRHTRPATHNLLPAMLVGPVFVVGPGHDALGG